MTLLKKRNGNGNRLFPTIRTGLSDLFDVDSFFREPFLSAVPWDGWRAQVPATNIRETDDDYIVELAAPGLKKKDFHVDVENGILEIKVEKEEESKDEKKDFTRREYSYHSFCRSFTLPEAVNAEKINAKYEDGVLCITLPKLAEARKKAVKEIAVA